VLLLLTAGSSRELTRAAAPAWRRAEQDVAAGGHAQLRRRGCPTSMPSTHPHRRRGGRGHARAAERCVGILDWVARRAGAGPFSWPFSFSWSRRLPRRVRARSRRTLDRKAGGLSSFRVLWRPVPRAERPSLSRAERNP
jgi:hypothetical protein